jgi:hypothetical protein
MNARFPLANGSLIHGQDAGQLGLREYKPLTVSFDLVRCHGR